MLAGIGGSLVVGIGYVRGRGDFFLSFSVLKLFYCSCLFSVVSITS